jgi:predicted nucleic acid-binding protein
LIHQLTKEFWIKLKNFDVFISDLVREEISKIKDKTLREKVFALVEKFKILKLTNQAKRLGEKYVTAGIIPKQFKADAYHVAIATVNEIDFLVSWNFKHLVNIRTKRGVNLINLQNGFKTIEIVSPPEL